MAWHSLPGQGVVSSNLHSLAFIIEQNNHKQKVNAGKHDQPENGSLLNIHSSSLPYYVPAFSPSVCSMRAAAPGRMPLSGSYPTISLTLKIGSGPSTPVWWASESCHLQFLLANGEMQVWVRGRLSEPWRLDSLLNSNVTRCVMSKFAFHRTSSTRRLCFM